MATGVSERERVEQSALVLAEELASEAMALAAARPDVVGSKSDALDVVTATDLAVEQRFRERIAEQFPGHAVLGEEEGLSGRRGGWIWIVDPIDGTFNYATSLVGVGSSIALMHEGELRVGALADFGTGMVLSGRAGAGVRWNGGPVPADIEAAATLGRARLMIDTGHQVPDPALYGVLERIARLAPLAPRIHGSAAVALGAVALAGGCLVGAGLQIWDAAAGMLLVQERGKTVRWWRIAGDAFHHVLAGEDELVAAFEPLMPDYIEAWRRKTTLDGPLLGPADTILLADEGE